METIQILPAYHSETDLRHPVSDGPKYSTPLAWLIAALLILLGTAFELGMLGFGPYNRSGFWLISVLGKNVWMAIADLAGPQMLNFLSTWPIALVTLGFSILMVSRRRNRFDSSSSAGSQGRTRHAK